MRRKIIFAIFISFLLLHCTKEIETTIDTSDILSDVFTFELEFGADNLPDEYLVVKPWTQDANDSNDVFVADESRIKVYDKDGKAKMIIGRPGQGPGEFSGANGVYISPTGYLTVWENIGFSIFSPEYKFIKKVILDREKRYTQLIREKGWAVLFTTKVYSFDINRYVFEGNAMNIFYPLIYADKDTLIVIAEYENTQLISFRRGRAPIILNGELFWAVPNSDKLYYTHTEYDRSKENGSYKYFLNVFNFTDYSKEHFEYEYYPVLISDSLITIQKKLLDDERRKAVRGQALDLISKIKYHPPLQRLYTDKNLIFAVTFYKNDDGEYLTDVIDADSGEKIKSVFFSILPRAIKNGYAYMLGYNEEGFAVIRKYRIDEAVYGK